MEPLFKTTTQYTLEEYKKFNKALMKKMLVILIIFEILLVLFFVATQNIFYLIFAVIYPIILFAIQSANIKKVFNSNKIMQDLDINFEFYKDYFIEKDGRGQGKIEYDKLYKIIETKTNFYLMIAKNQGYMLSKENFPDGLEEFIKNIKINK